MTKQCNKCKKIKDVSKFYKRNGYSSSIKAGYRYVCIICDNILSNIRRKKNGYKYASVREFIGSKHHKLSKINSRKHRVEMSDMYIRSLITKKSKFLKSKDIPDEIIELHRINLKLKRTLKLTPKLKGEEG